MGAIIEAEFKKFLDNLEMTCSVHAGFGGTAQELAASIRDTCQRTLKRMAAAKRKEEKHQEELSALSDQIKYGDGS
jgi:glutamyl-tRNA reductase